MTHTNFWTHAKYLCSQGTHTTHAKILWTHATHNTYAKILGTLAFTPPTLKFDPWHRRIISPTLPTPFTLHTPFTHPHYPRYPRHPRYLANSFCKWFTKWTVPKYILHKFENSEWDSRIACLASLLLCQSKLNVFSRVKEH